MAKSLPELLSNDEDIYLFPTEDGVILFRPLSYKDYKIVDKIIKYYPDHLNETEDWVWEKCIIEHSLSTPLNNIPAGTVVTLFNCILTLSCPSGIDDANQRLALARQDLKDVLNSSAIVICQAFPNYTTKQVQDMNWADIVKKLSEAEVILDKTLDFRRETGPKDDSKKIFDRLDKMSKDDLDVILRDKPVDFKRENSKIRV
jgi:hypothetical protein